jgi:tape measure domain-containing protein
MEPVRIEFLMVDKLSARLDKAVNKMEEMTGKTAQANRQMREMDKSSMSLQKTVGRLASAFALKELVSKIATVRGEYQQLDVAFKTMLGSAEQADALMQQLTRTAATTPFGLEDVAQGAKQLLAYGLEAEKVNDTLIRLGDIAAGLSMPLNDLVYLYGTTMAQGRLYTQDLNQFTGRGIPMISELAKQFGVAESKVKELVEAGKVGFPEVQKVIESLTDEGDKFGGLMEAQSKTITGQISNIEDNISMMMNELGQQSEGIINMTLSGVSDMTENYERFGRMLLGLVGTYGVYKTAVMTVTAAKGWATAAEALHFNWLLLVEKAQKMLNATMLANPYVLVATAIAGVVAAMVSMKTEAERLKEAEEAYEAQKQKVIEAEEEHKRKIEELCSIAGDEAISTDTRREALNRLEQKYPDIFAKYDTEYEKLKNIKKIKEEIALLDGQKSITNPVNELKRVEDRIRELEQKKATKRTSTTDAGDGKIISVTMGGLSQAEQAELRNLQTKRSTLSAQVRKNGVNAYFENLTGVSNETLAQQIRVRETLLAKMKMTEKNYGRISNGSLAGTYSRDELQYQLNKLRSEENRRSKPVDSSSDWAAAAKKKYQETLKAYNDFINNTGNKLTQEDFEKKAKELKDAADTAKKEYDKVKPGTDKDAETEKKTSEKAAREAEKRKQLAEKLGQELAEQLRENDAVEIDIMDDGTEKKLHQIANDYQARKNEIAKQESDWKRDNQKAGTTDLNDNGLTEEQQAAIDSANSLNKARTDKLREDLKKEEEQAMREYLSKYGEYEEQKLAITQDYETRIAEASTKGEKQTLQKEMEKALSDLDTEKLKDSMDWEAVFGDLDKVSTAGLKKLREQLKEYIATQKHLDPESMKELVEAIGAIEAKVNERNPFAALRTTMGTLSDATEKLRAAQEAYNAALSSGTEEEKKNAEATLTSARNAKRKALAEATDALQNTVGKMKEYVGVAEDLTGLVGQLGIEPPEWLDGFLSGTDQVLDGLGSINLTNPMSVVSGGIKALSGAVKQVTSLGGAINWNGSNGKDVAATIERLTERNALLQTAIEDLTSEISSTKGAEAIRVSRRAIDMQRETNSNYLQMAQTQAGYHGSHHSWNKYWGGFSGEQIGRLSGQIGREWDGDLWGLSPEEMSMLRSNVDMWEQIRNTGKGGYGRSVADKLDDYIAQAGKMEELQNALYENLTTTTKEDVFDGFLDSLYALADGSDDVFDDIAMNWQKMVNRMAVNNLVGAKFQKNLEKWYEDLAKLNESRTNGEISDEEYQRRLEKLRREYDGFVSDAEADIEALRSAGIIDNPEEAGGTSQKGKAGGFMAMTQDQGTKLEGMFTSGLQHWSSMDERMEDVAGKMNSAENHLAKIEENTGKSAAHLETIAENVVKIIRDGLKVK